MHILLAGHFDYSSSAADALRMRGLAMALIHAGHDVSVLDSRPGIGAPARSRELQRGAFVEIASVDEYDAGLFSWMSRGIRGLFLGDVGAAFVRRQAIRPDVIIVSGPHLLYLARFQRLARDLGVPLVLDIVEWYQPEDLKGGRFGPFAIANEIAMRRHTKHVDGVITVSRRLASHYSAAGVPVLLVRPLFEPDPAPAVKWSGSDRCVHLCYAGSPARKEALDLTFSCLGQAIAEGLDIVVHVAGLRPGDFEAILRRAEVRHPDRLSERTRLYGRVPNKRAREIVGASDFTLLLRPHRKANEFGFPSKLCESMMLSTPVIANNFSDLAEYLVDGDNAVFFRDLNRANVMGAFRRAAAMSMNERREMAERARQIAEASFSVEACAASLASFIESFSRRVK